MTMRPPTRDDGGVGEGDGEPRGDGHRAPGDAQHVASADEVERVPECGHARVRLRRGKRRDALDRAGGRVDGVDGRRRPRGRDPARDDDAAVQRRDAGVARAGREPRNGRRVTGAAVAEDRARELRPGVAADEVDLPADHRRAEIGERLVERPRTARHAREAHAVDRVHGHGLPAAEEENAAVEQRCGRVVRRRRQTADVPKTLRRAEEDRVGGRATCLTTEHHQPAAGKRDRRRLRQRLRERADARHRRDRLSRSLRSARHARQEIEAVRLVQVARRDAGTVQVTVRPHDLLRARVDDERRGGASRR